MTVVRRLLRLVPIALAAFAAACSDATLTEFDAVPSVPEPYALETINGQALPMEMRNDASGRVLVAKGELSLGGNTFWQKITLNDVSPSGIVSVRESVTEGTFTVASGGRIHFRSSAGTEWDGNAQTGWIFYSFAGNSGPVSFAFRKL
jgi:hypothetical protein